MLSEVVGGVSFHADLEMRVCFSHSVLPSGCCPCLGMYPQVIVTLLNNDPQDILVLILR